MRTFVPFVVVGLATGSVYGIAGMGLVLTYKTSGIFNFAHGAIATVAAYLFYEFHVRHGWPWPIAGLVAIFVVGPVLGMLLERLAYVLALASSSMKIVATVGLLISVQALAVLWYGPVTRDFPQFLPTRSFDVGGVNVGSDQFIVFVLGLAALGGLYAFFRTSRLGLAMRGVVDDPDLLCLTGTCATVVRRWAWIIGSSFAALSGILLAPSLGLDGLLLTLLVVQAFGAAAIGAFSSLPLTYVGGLVIGVGAALATKYVAGVPALGGIPPSLPFIVLFAVLLFSPKGRLAEVGTETRRRVVERTPLSPRRKAVGLTALAIGLVLIPALVGTRLPVYTSGLLFVPLFLSLGLLVQTSNQVSLCQMGFAAVGGAAFSHLSHGLGIPWPVALLGAGLAAVPIGAFIAIPAIRLSGLYLALATFGFGVLLERMGYTSMFLFGRDGRRPAPRPHLPGVDLHTDTGYYYVVLAVVLLCFVLVVAVNRSRLGRLLRAMADSPVALATHGTNVNLTRVLVFCISAFLAGIAGGLMGPLTGTTTALSFNSFQSLIILAVLAMSVAFAPGPVLSAVVAAAAFVVIPSYFRSPTVAQWLQANFGVSALVAALAETGRLRMGIGPGTVERARARLRASPVATRTASARSAAPVGTVGS